MRDSTGRFGPCLSLAICIGFGSINSVNAEEIETEHVTASEHHNPTIWHSIFTAFEDFRDATSKRYYGWATGIDRYFSGEKLEKINNKSHLKLEFKNTFYKAGEIEQDVKLKAKLHLPNTSDRLKLIFDSSPDEDKDLEERELDVATGERVKDDSSVAGLEYEVGQAWQQKVSARIRLSDFDNPYLKYRLKNDWRLDENWTARAEQSFWYYNQDGFREATEISFDRPITENYSMDVSSELEFRDDENTYYYDLILATIHRFDHTSSMRYYTGALGRSQPTNQINTYIIGSEYRKLLYKDWLYLNIKPQINLPRNDGWKPTPSLTFKLQVYFTGQ